jgi:formylglycine-generating enzyme required for sulfatase activity
LIGNVWEWTATRGTKDDDRVIVGGSWSNPAGDPPDSSEIGRFTAPDGNRAAQGETRQTNNLGFRCVWDGG